MTFKRQGVLIASAGEDPTGAVTAEQTMPESDDMAAARLETALERIARCAAARRAAPAGAAVMAGSDPRLRELASRLDALIASLRAVLGEQG